MLLLGYVVGHVVDDPHPHGFRGPSDDGFEGLPDPVGYHLPVGPGVVRPAGHGAVVSVAEAGVQRSAGELAVGEGLPCGFHVALHLLEVVRGYLVAASSGPAVDGDGDGPLPQAECSRGVLVVDLVHHVHLQEVVPGSQGSELSQASLACLLAHVGRVGVGHASALLRRDEVGGGPVSVLHSPCGSCGEDLLQFPGTDPGEALGAQSRRDVGVERIHQRIHASGEVLGGEVGAYEPDPAVDVETDAARGYGPGLRIHGGHTADGEPVAPVYVGHGHGAADDPGEAGHVGRLEGGVVFPDLREHPLAGVDDGVGEHAGHSSSGYLPPAVVDPPEFAVPCH